MIIHKYIKRGLNHANYCEDFILHETLADKYELFGVFDGCSSGVDSHFASAFIAKIIRGVFRKLDIEIFATTKKLLKKLLFDTIEVLKKQKQELDIRQNELLSTIVLFLFDKQANSGIIISVGDGIISINGKHSIIDENNVPDYLAYHLAEINSKADFKAWYKAHTRTFFVDNLRDVSISTDGAASFVQTKNAQGDVDKPNILDYLFTDDFLIKNKAMLGRKCNVLERKHSLVNGDDLGIIRVVY